MNSPQAQCRPNAGGVGPALSLGGSCVSEKVNMTVGARDEHKGAATGGWGRHREAGSRTHHLQNPQR